VGEGAQGVEKPLVPPDDEVDVGGRMWQASGAHGFVVYPDVDAVIDFLVNH